MAHQREFHEQAGKSRVRAVAGGRRLGKSEMVGHDRGPPMFEPKKLGWIIGPSYDLALKEFRVMWDDLIIQLKMGHDKRVKRKFNPEAGDMYIEMPWGARVECRSTKYKDSLVGEGLDWVVYSEAAKIPGDVHQRYVRGALSDKRGEIIACSTPEGKNWFYKDLWYPGIKGRDAHWARRYPSWVNTVIFPGGYDDPEIQLIKATTLEEWFDQEYAAKFTAVVGRILGEFDETVHVKEHVFNPAWPNYITFDWGFANPLAAMEFQVAPDDTIHVWREHYYRHRTLEWHIETIKNRENPEGYRLDGGFGDCADPEQVAYASQHLVPVAASPKAKENWLTGIRLYKRMLKEHPTGLFDEYDRPIMKPHYYVDPSCENHISEMLEYKTKDNASPNEFKSAGVVDRSCEDHSIDALRYGQMHLFEIGKYHLSDVADERSPDWAAGKTKRERIDVPVPAASAPGTFFSFSGTKTKLSQRF